MMQGHNRWRFEAYEQPELHQYMMRSARIYSLGFVFLVGGVGLGVVALWPRWEPGFALYWAWMLLWNLVLWRATEAARRVSLVEMTIAAQSVSLTALIATSFWWLGQPTHYTVGSLIWLGPLMGALFPMHIRVGLLCYTGLLLSMTLGAWLAPPVSGASVADLLFGMPPLVMIGLLASQARRKQWWERHQAREQISSGQRMMEMGRRAAAISHELKTPLAASTNALHSARELAREWIQSAGHPEVGPQDMAEILEEAQRALHSAESNLTRIRGFLEALKQQTQAGASTPEISSRFDLSTCVTEVVEMMRQAKRLRDVEIQSEELPAGCWLEGSLPHMEQILLNLLENAEVALRDHPQPRISIWLEGHPPHMRLMLQDNGPGIPQELRGRLFEAMVTTRQAEGRAGLGLSMCRDLAQGAFGGDLQWVDRPGGACFQLLLPGLTLSPAPYMQHASRPARRRPKA